MGSECSDCPILRNTTTLQDTRYRTSGTEEETLLIDSLDCSIQHVCRYRHVSVLVFCHFMKDQNGKSILGI